MNDIKFSIVIPVYNNTDTIERCLDSVCSQSYKTFEVIVINDGSDADYSYLKEKYEKINLIELPENRGQSYARQYALDNVVTGDWVLFVDADDELIGKAVLMTVSRIIHRHQKDVIIKSNYTCTDNTKDYRDFHSFIYPLYGIFYNVNFLKENNIRFCEELRIYEDQHFNLQCNYIIKNKYENKGICEISQLLYKQHISSSCLTKQKYDTLDLFLENVINIELDMLYDLYNKFSDILSITDKRTLFVSAFVKIAYLYAKIEDNRFNRILQFMPKLTLLVDKFNTEFNKINRCNFAELFNLDVFDDDFKNFVGVILRDSNYLYNDFINFFDDVFSFYLFYKNNIPYKKEKYDTSLPLLSIILPVYNSKGFIRNTLDKLYSNLDMNYCELIIVNDCSPDGDYDYLEDDYFHLKVYKNTCNKGYANSRQIGLDNATGKWLIFLDHDDEISGELIPDLLKVEEDPTPYQLLVYTCCYKRGSFMYENINKEELNMVHGSVFNLKFIRDNNIRYQAQFKTGEDVFLHRTVHHIIANSYPFLIRKNFDIVVYTWNLREDSQSNIVSNNRTWSENHYGEQIRCRLLALNFKKEILDEEYRISVLYQLLYEALTNADIWEISSKNFRYELRDEIPMIAAELYLHGCRYNNLERYNERYNDSVIDGITRALFSQNCNTIGTLEERLVIPPMKYVLNLYTPDVYATEFIQRRASWAFRYYFTHRIYYKSYNKIYSIDSPQLRTVDPFSIQYVQRDGLNDIIEKNNSLTLLLYAIKTKQEFEFIYNNKDLIKNELNGTDIKFFMHDDLYWECDKDMRESMKDLYLVNNYEGVDTLSMNQDFRYLMLTSFINSPIFHATYEYMK